MVCDLKFQPNSKAHVTLNLLIIPIILRTSKYTLICKIKFHILNPVAFILISMLPCNL